MFRVSLSENGERRLKYAAWAVAIIVVLGVVILIIMYWRTAPEFLPDVITVEGVAIDGELIGEGCQTLLQGATIPSLVK